ncbi:U-box domain-containing protein 52-like isoform X2 [Dioscorea cayenensis subsp. rotundata]|nr:U-box domain-containing protein 52-like isoform X2 [Dioscorea cayenensis subsp. rotundata]
MSSRISKQAPRFCNVYVVSKGKLSSVRPPASGTDDSPRAESNSSFRSLGHSSDSFSVKSESSETDTTTSASCHLAPLPTQRRQALAAINYKALNMGPISGGTLTSRSLSCSTDEDFRSFGSSMTEDQFTASSIFQSQSFQMDKHSQNFDQASTSKSVTSENQFDASSELEKLRIVLKRVQGMCQITQSESNEVSQQITELTRLREDKLLELKQLELNEEILIESARQEMERHAATEAEAEVVRQCADEEASQKRNVEFNTSQETDEKYSNERYRKFTWEEIETATSLFSEALQIGAGANGKVYKGSFHHTVAAVKILHSNESYGTKQFRQELEILSRIQHPHLLMLLGACPDRGCLVYELMKNGSLEDRLNCKDNTPPLPWYDRYRIAWEVALALSFLHNSKPEPIIHRDLKPANILLDENFVSKIGDVGVSSLIPTVNVNSLLSTIYKDTAPVGTLCYIDPEYQRSGLVSPKSDVYALGIVILQLLTARPPMGLTHIVETAIEEGTLMDILDTGAGKWPLEETQKLAAVGLNCAEMRRKDRPDLENQVLPFLERLKRIADNACDLAQLAPSIPPNHFICPLLKDVMDDPCVASDGFTYERKEIERWFGMSDNSPMTKLKLPDKNLVPSLSLLSAIKEWKKSRSQ